MFQVYVPNISSASDVCCIQLFHISEVCSESYGGHGGRGKPGARGWGTLGASGRRAWRAWGSADGGVLVLIPAPRSRPRRERGTVPLGRSRRRNDKGGVCVRGVTRRTWVGWAGIQALAIWPKTTMLV